MTRSQIDYILTLAETRNFGRAAEACFVTQSTLSAMVAKVEEQIGITLFNRNTRPISITPQGEEVLRSLRSISREYQLLDETITQINGHEVGHLSIACIPTVAPYLYPLILDQISKAYPDVEFSIHELTTEQITEEIISGHIDIGIVSTPLDHNQLSEYNLYTEDFLVYDCGKQRTNKRYKISDIDLDRLWLMEEGHCLRNQVGKICELQQQKKINGNLVYSCGSIFTLIEMVKKNKGVTLLPRLAIKGAKQVKKDQLHDISGKRPTRMIGLITHKNYTKKRMLQHLQNIIKNSIDKYLPVSTQKERVIEPF